MAGPRAISRLNKKIEDRLYSIYEKNYAVLVGDASGVDKAMANDADYGLMLWNGESKGTLNNIINLLTDSKKALVYFSPQNSFVYVDDFEKLEMLLAYCDDNTRVLFDKLHKKLDVLQEQLTMF